MVLQFRLTYLFRHFEDIVMRSNLVRWGTAIGALRRISEFRQVLAQKERYIDRLRFVNTVLGPDWVFRLPDTVGLETIKTNRPSWNDFYVDDTDGVHLPLDPGAPETNKYLGEEYSIKDLAFYAGMGFDGYCLALKTERNVDLIQKNIRFDGRYLLRPTPEQLAVLEGYERAKLIPKEAYYNSYRCTLDALYELIDQIESDFDAGDDVSDERIECAIAGSVILLCGGHQGCGTHPTKEIEFQVQMLSLITFDIARNVIGGDAYLEAGVINKTEVTV